MALLLPAGGFTSPVPPMLDARSAARQAGFRPVELDYPLGLPISAWRFVRARARQLSRQGETVVAYGESAGGTLAAGLGVHGLARFTVANSPVSNLPRWDARRTNLLILATTQAQRRILSPAFHCTQTPILVMASPQDTTFPYALNRRWARGDPRVHLFSFTGGHIAPPDDPAAYRRELETAFSWLRSGLDRARPAEGEAQPENEACGVPLEDIEALVDRVLALPL